MGTSTSRSARRRGVATTLIAAAEQHAVARGATAIHVGVGHRNNAARALYESLGYAAAGIAPRHVRGTIRMRTGPIEVDDVIVTLAKPLRSPR